MSVFNNYKLDLPRDLEWGLYEYDGTQRVIKSEENAITHFKSTIEITNLIDRVSKQILIDKVQVEEKAKEIIKDYKCSQQIAPAIAGAASIIYLIVMLTIFFTMTDKMVSSCGFVGSLFLVFGIPFVILGTTVCCENENINTISKRDWAIMDLHSDFDNKLYKLDKQLGLIITNNDQEEITSQLLETKHWFSLLNDDIFCSLIYNMFKRLKEINKDEKNSELLPWRTLETRRDALFKFRYKEIQSPFPPEIWKITQDYF